MEKSYAGFWIRLGATAIDIILMLIIFTVPTILIYGSEYWQSDRIILGFWDFMLNYVLPILLVVWFWLRYCATPGKMATKLKVVDAKTGNKLSLGQAFGRYFAYIPAVLPLGLGLLWIGFDKKKQGWHDKLAGTVVIKDDTPVPVTFDKEEE